MKIIIQYDARERAIDTDEPPTACLDELLDTFTPDQTQTLLNQTAAAFRGMIELWNKWELKARAELEEQ